MYRVVGQFLLFALGFLFTLFGVFDRDASRGWRFAIMAIFFISLSVLYNFI